MNAKVNLTKSNRELILHRLQVPDAVADCLSDAGLFEYQLVHDRVNELARMFSSISPPLIAITLGDSYLDDEIFRDCLEGSTFFASSLDAVATREISKGKWMSMMRAANLLELKFQNAGMSVAIPRE